MIGINFGSKLRQYAIVITVNFSMLCSGLALGWSSPILVKLMDPIETVLHEPASDSEISWIVSASSLTSTLGRKNSVILATIPHIVGCLIILFAQEVWLFILARAIIGVSLGMNFNVSPTYAAEIASKEIRGSLGTILQISTCLGMTIMLAIGPFVPYLALNLIYTSAIVLTAIPMFFLPDSPYYLYSKGRTDEALKILLKLRGSDSLAKEEIAEYEITKTDTKVNIHSLLKDLIFLKTVLLVIVFGIFTQVSGSNTIAFYLQPILESTKTNISSEIASAVIGLIMLLGSIFTAFFTDRCGRKPILIWAFFGMAIAMVGFGACFMISSETKQMYTFIGFIPIICLVLNVFCNSAGQGSLFFTVTAEMFEGPSRALGVSTAFFTASLFSFLMAKYLDTVLTLLGPSVTYWGCGGLCVLAGVFVMLLLPETKMKTFAEIQKILGRKT
ncbi:hypothetical protein ABMA27_009581 [Loxostege sticticalis]|uniref:Major facilitator superfamily (MFS) profile domain-containing protein n=1 Tax=Loxostege sticticalis TaxID=481309 RepID=A0ABR3H8F0_LOXSC